MKRTVRLMSGSTEEERIRIAILGAGNMGTALAQSLSSLGHSVSIWDIHLEVLSEIENQRKNSRFLPGILLNDSITPARTPEECVMDARLIVVCIPSVFAPATLIPLSPLLLENAVILNVSKGFAPDSPLPVATAIQSILPKHPIVHLAGPAIANEFVNGRQTFVVMASHSDAAACQVSRWFEGPHFSCSTHTDLTGAALGGILKNIYAILLGAISEMLPEISPNQEAAILTACMEEMARTASLFGGCPDTLYGLSGLGDLLATGYSSNSHNRRLGKTLAAGATLESIESEIGNLPEGARATPFVLAFARNHGATLPLAEWVDELLNGSSPTHADLLKKMTC